jgi:hypothetical protein
VTARKAFTVREAFATREVFAVRIVLIKQVSALRAQLPAGASKSKPIIADGSATKGHEQ